LRKSFRVKKEKEFQKVYFKGESCANRRFIVYRLDVPEQKHFRVGISVGKKIGNAVARDSVKRKIRQALLELKADIRPDVDFIIIARPTANELTMAETEQNIQHVLKLAKVISE